ncbi:peptidase M48 [Spirochaetia bacterium]|nr:peptidase M48 [Spirochaetia bacterium]
MKTPNMFIKLSTMLLILLSLGFLSSCESVAKAVNTGTRIASEKGYIDQGTADAITKSADAISKAAEDITPEQEYYIGRAVGATILTSYKIWNGSPALTAYLNRICNTLVINSPKPEIYNGYHVAILDSNEINAFATSGGHIFITRGLLGCAESEDALAGVIAHEISHIQLQHSIKSIKTSRITQALLVTGSSAASAAGLSTRELTDIFGESVGEIVTTMVNNGYSQTQEFDADTNALSLMAGAGYEPSSLISMLQVLEKNQAGQSGGFSKTHPTPTRRISNANLFVGKYHLEDTRRYRQARYNQTK